jgi:hypothetical protein
MKPTPANAWFSARLPCQQQVWFALWLALTGTTADGAAPPDPLNGRLFHTPAERAALDRADRAAAPAIPRPPARPLRRPAEQDPALSGFVLRSDGHDSYWIAPAAPIRQ